MQLIAVDSDEIVTKLTRDELGVINNALNEICNGIDVEEFETRIGATREEVGSLLKQLREAAGSPRNSA